MTLKNNRAPLLCCFQLCAWFHCHMWIQTGVRVRKRLSWVLTSVTLTFDLWPWPFAWTSLLTMVITSWWYDDGNMVKKVWQTDGRMDRRTDRQTDRQTENTICRAACSQLKMKTGNSMRFFVFFQALPSQEINEPYLFQWAQHKIIEFTLSMYHYFFIIYLFIEDNLKSSRAAIFLNCIC